MGYAFISYSSKNQKSADAIRDAFRNRGIETWMAPGDIPAGSKYAQVINQAVKGCSCFVLVLSKDAQNSVWVAKEVERAVNYRKVILPVQIENVILNDEFELYISTDQVIAVQKIDEESPEMKKIFASVIANTGVQKTLTYYLQSTDGREIFELKKGIQLIGRNREKVDICINNDTTISRVHAALTVSDTGCTVRDLHSVTSTFLNDMRLIGGQDFPLKKNDILRFGERSEYIFKSSEARRDFTATEEDKEIHIGSIIDERYEVTDLLGSGKFAQVYLAINKKTGKKWTVKAINKNADFFEKAKDRYFAEIKTLNRLDHPGLPTVADIFETKKQLLIIMDYIDGKTLMQLVEEQGKQSESAVIGWAKQLCDIIGYLHSQEPPIIHNDIHPQNIMLKNNRNLSLIDFGASIERTIDQPLPDRGETTLLTAPEALNGNIDTSSDIYSLGASLYVLLSGIDPSKPPYSFPLLHEANPRLSDGIVYIIQKSMERNPESRYQSIDEMRKDLDEIDTINARLSKNPDKTDTITAEPKKKRGIFGIFFKK